MDISSLLQIVLSLALKELFGIDVVNSVTEDWGNSGVWINRPGLDTDNLKSLPDDLQTFLKTRYVFSSSDTRDWRKHTSDGSPAFPFIDAHPERLSH